MLFYLLLPWQLLQTLCGLMLALVFIRKLDKVTRYRNAILFRIRKFAITGISFGPVILVDSRANERIVRHEYGHSIQSMLLGPLYLFVVGVPSVSRGIYTRRKGLSMEYYFSGYPENWADRLGGVDSGH